VSEVDGFGRLPGPRGGLRTAQLSPGVASSAAGPTLAAAYLFPMGYWDGTHEPNQSLVWSVNAWAADLGVGSLDTPLSAGMQVATMPGRTYTASMYAQQSAPNDLYAAVVDLSVADGFNRNTAPGWGGGWTTSGGAASDYATAFAATGGTATHLLTSVAVSRRSSISSSCWDASQAVGIATNALATGAAITAGLMLRYADVDNHYRCVLSFNTNQSVSIILIRRKTTDTTIATATTSLTHVANSIYRLRFEMPGDNGTSFQARAWLDGTDEPTTWDLTGSDSGLGGTGALGCYSKLETGNTNTLPVTVSFTTYAASNVTVLGTSTDVPLEWDRLTLTFVATQPQHTLCALTIPLATNRTGFPAIPLPGSVRADDVQMEPGSSASAFTTSGPVIYPVFRNYAERWPRVWLSEGFEGFTRVPCVDAFAALSAITIPTEYHAAVHSLEPDYYWHLDEGTTAALFTQSRGDHSQPLMVLNSKYGPASTFSVGNPTDIVGDPGGTGLSTYSASVSDNTASPVVARTGFSLGGSGTSVSVTAAVWIAHSGNFAGSGAQNPALTLSYNDLTNTNLLMQLNGANVPPNKVALTAIAGGVSSLSLATDTWGDGLAHLYIAIVTFTASNVSTALYVDGVLVASNTTAGASSAPWRANMVQLGGYVYVSNLLGAPGWPGATYAHFALWDRALSTTEIAHLWTAGSTGFAGITTGQRITNHLAIGNYSGPTRISTGSSTMQAPTYEGTIDLLTDCQNTATTEQGNLWVAPDGALVFEGRLDRFLRLDPTYILGEDVANGEVPYLGSIEFDYDPNFVYAQVTATRTGGATAAGGTEEQAEAAARRYFPRSYSASVDIADDGQVQDLADWVFATHRAPVQRVSTVTLDPASSTDPVTGVSTVWPVALGVEIGMRLTLRRRAKAANSGAGITMSADYFVEQVSHSINMKGVWTTQLWLSPVGDATSGDGVTMQPWILGHSVYGVLGSTTVLGW
jgi:hypothetical protein